jgi:signal transduction histidine kinase
MDQEDADLRSRGILLVLKDGRGGEIAEDGSHRHSARVHPGQRVRTARVGADTAVFSLSWAEEERNLERQAAGLGVVAVVIVLACGIGAWALVGHTLSPIQELSRQANAASAETLLLRLEAPSDDAEVVDLVRTLNGLLGRVSDAAAARGRFYAAASHELRTPLQALLGHLELGISRERAPAEYRAVIEEARQQANRLIALTRDLLFLNRIESRNADAPSEAVDLAELCARAVRAGRSIADERAVCVTVNGPESIPIVVPSSHAEVMVRNIVENALKYTPRGGTVDIRLAADPPRLEVVNDCDPASAWEPERLFEALYRADTARASESGGNGLGLAICKAIADADGWTLTVSRESARFHVTAIPGSTSNIPPHLQEARPPV